jgi:UDP-N-acetylglucosamine 4-epimerase
MLFAARGAKIKRFIYAASSSSYGDSEILPKVEEIIGKPLSPYAVSKYVNELYAHVFGLNYGLETIGLRYFNVFGRRQDPKGAYAAVIPKFILQLISHKKPCIYGNGETSRDFTYIDNVIQMNSLALTANTHETLNTIYNTAYGERTTLNNLVKYLKECLSEYDPGISKIEVIYAQERSGDIPHSLASVEKAKELLGYCPEYNIQTGLRETVKWYWNNAKNDSCE